ncbi:hypothetical protein TTHERM_01073500 (macronuclear) [Tetrahymena thermophila SB210]|uniref:Uncharacterized protein n=1 Tax=Tetrahymena thermophila (strain SB210) TaxID=312017 RepID=Q24FN8_TETTS|nr:hypothetical protein TTHERM_01073500 [Tetrahymena thermophila SB210]EAS06606.1 hypothetical protein TTHERM_01073500 [Tetrahymena thermophila SB210]|eukprot:XP_001026851.1 hypothetical protein TTHERM_01073500 [Tetrahymena thermophila SB210]
MEISEEEAIKNLNDVSNLWFSSDCVDINLKSLSNNLASMSEETNYSRAKCLKYQGRKSQELKRPMSQQRQSSAICQRKRHSFSIYQDNSFLYDFQNSNQKNFSKPASTNEILNYSQSQFQNSIEHSSRSSYYVDSGSQQYNKFLKNSFSKANEFLGNLTGTGTQQTKREQLENYQKILEKDRQSKEQQQQQQQLIVYGNSNNCENSYQESEGRVVLSCIKNKNKEKKSLDQQQRQLQCRTSVNISQNNSNSDISNNILNTNQASKNDIFYSSQTNFNSQKKQQTATQNSFRPSKNSSHYFQKVLDKQQNQKNQCTPQNQLQINQKENLNQSFVQSNNQKDENNINNNKPQLTSYKANEFIENCPQFLVKLKSRFSRAPSFYRKNTPIKNSISQQNNNISINPSRKDLLVGNVLNPKNIYNQNNTQNQNQDQQHLQNSFYSSNPTLSFLQIIPTQINNSNQNKNSTNKVWVKGN